MTAGLPGTGIGGLFFILSAFFMIVVELQRTVRRKSSLARWRIVGRHAGVAAAMVASVTVTIWLVHSLLFASASKSGTAGGKTSSSLAHEIVPFSPVLITLAVLMLVLLTSYLAKFVFRTTAPATPDTPRDAMVRAVQPPLRTAGEPLLATSSHQKPMIQVCGTPGCETLSLGTRCINHEPSHPARAFPRGRPWPPISLPAEPATAFTD
jgi:hypothetical protein